MNKLLRKHGNPPLFYQFFRKMKLTILIVTASILSCFSAETYSQTTKLTITENNSTLLDILKVIEGQSEFKFFYNEKVDVAMAVTVEANQKSVTEILDKILSSTSVKYKVLGRQIALYDKNEMEPFMSEQQARVIKGKVTDQTGAPIPGASVVVKETTIGAMTDNNGNFSLSLPRDGKILSFSFLGLRSQEIAIDSKTEYNVVLSEETIGLEEVVAIGYGTVKRSDLTGAVSSVTSNDIKKEPVTNLAQAIQGKAPGVVVMANSGAPGGNIKVRIRGANSMQGSNEPLYVVDGVALNIGINDLNVNDIESVEVLKDASSTAIYGSRGANGVIMITTKGGKSGATRAQVTINTGFSNLAKKYDLLDAGSFSELVNVYKPNYYTAQQIADYKKNGGVDWQNEVFKTGVTQDYQVNINGGSETIKYYLSGNYIDQTGVVTGAKLSKYSVRGNVHTDLGDKFKIDLNLAASRANGVNNGDNGSKGAPLWNTPLFPPTFPIYKSPGVWNRTDNLSGPGLMNPLMVLKERYSDMLSSSFTVNSRLTYKIIKDLTFEAVFGADNSSIQNGFITNKVMNPVTSAASLSENKIFTWQNSNILTYHKKISDIHDFTVVAVGEQSQFTYNGFGATGSDINPISVGYDNLGIANTKNVSSYKTQNSLRSYMGRFSYSFMNKYLLTATYRADGTSKFQGKNKWGYFPAAALAWRVTEESFLKDITAINNLKVRGSWGITGNQGINTYATIAKIGSMSNSFGLPAMVPGSIVSGADNPNLKWETTEQMNIGFDLSVLKNRLNLTFDYYKKNTSDLLHSSVIPSYDGGGIVNQNIGAMENKGYEISLAGSPVSGRYFKWNTSFNISAYKNKLLNLGKDTFMLGGIYAAGLTQESPFAIKVGQPIGSFWGYEWQGVYKTSEATEAAKYGFKPGDNKYLDYNHDGKIDSKDKHIIGNALPKFVWGFDNTFSYKNFDLDIMFQAVVGRKILNTVYAASTTILSDATAITHVDGKDYWSTSNENARFASPITSTGKNFIESTQFLQDGSYVKLKNIALSYNLNKKVIKLADVKITMSIQNLLTFTKYKGYDPETSTSGISDIDGAIDVGSYPNSRTVTFSLQANF